MNRLILFTAFAVILIIGAVVLINNQTNNLIQEQAPAQSVQNQENKPTTPAIREFTVTGSNFKFDPNELKIKKGDTVKITFKNSEGFHDFTIEEFNAKTSQIPAGQEDTIEFVVDKTGSFEFYCSVGNHREMGMRGVLIVE